MNKSGSAAIQPTAAGAPLLEREAELALLDRLLDGCSSGVGGLVLVTGPAGIGKTALLGAACDRARRYGARVLSARGGELEHDLVFGVARQLFERLLHAVGAGERRRLLSGAARLAAPLVGFESIGEGDPLASDREMAVLHGLYWLTANLADRTPVLLAIDDAQWIDPGSLRFVGYLARRVSELQVALVLGARAEDRVAAALHDSDGRVRLELSPLSGAAVARLVCEALGACTAPEFCEAVRVATGGNPFLTIELLRSLVADQRVPTRDEAARVGQLSPESISRWSLARLAHLSAQAGALARAVAVLGGRSELRLAAAVAKLDLDSALIAADELSAARILSGRPLEFAHPLVRSAIYQDIGAGQRALTHARAARLLAAEQADSTAVAAHLLASEPSGAGDVVAQLRRAAEDALARGVPSLACDCLRRALHEPPSPSDRSELLGELARAEALCGDAAAVEHLLEALALTGDPARRGELTLALGELLIHSNRAAEALPHWTTAILELGDGERDLRLRLEVQRAVAGLLDRRLSAAVEDAADLSALASPSGAGRLLLVSLAMRGALRGDPAADVVDLLEGGLDGGRVVDEEREPTIVLTQALCALTFVDELDRADALLEALTALARQRSSVLAHVTAAMWRSIVALRRGRLADAEAEARAAAPLAEEAGLHLLAPVLWCCQAEALLEQGTVDEASCAIEAIAPDALAPGATAARALFIRGRVHIAAGRPTAAIADLRACGEIYEAIGFLNPTTAAWRSTLALALPADRRGEADALLTVELERGHRSGDARTIGGAMRAQGVLRRDALGIGILEQATTILMRGPDKLEYARALTDLGSALRRGNQRAAAREPLRQAVELAHRCGAARLAERAREELVATGARPRRLVLRGIDALTISELRVARMAAEGMSNREIAQALFISMNTVTRHLTHVYQKLDITNRAQLADALFGDESGPRRST